MNFSQTIPTNPDIELEILHDLTIEQYQFIQNLLENGSKRGYE